MKTPLIFLITAAVAAATPVSDHLGLQLWSLRLTSMQKGWIATLNQSKELGFTYVEGGSLGDLKPAAASPEDYNAKLASLGLKMVSMHMGYDRLAADLPGAVAEAKALGVEYVITPWITHHKDDFTLEDAQTPMDLSFAPDRTEALFSTSSCGPRSPSSCASRWMSSGRRMPARIPPSFSPNTRTDGRCFM